MIDKAERDTEKGERHSREREREWVERAQRESESREKA